MHGVTGGGIDGKNVVHSKAPKVEPRARAMSVGAVSRIGIMQGEGSKLKPMLQGPGYNAPRGPNYSDGSQQGPGSNHKTYRCGSQGQHGSASGGIARPGSDGAIFPGLPGKK
jgi:hypothetical protein